MNRLILILVLLFAVGCEAELAELRERYRPGSPREAYLDGLETTGISESAVASEWILQGEDVLDTALTPTLPYREEGNLYPTEIMALGYRISLERGQQLIVEASSREGFDLFVDLYEVRADMGLPRRRIASADSTSVLRHDITRTQNYFLRVQPEILSQGHFQVSIRTDASIVFPVSGKDSGAVQSFWGDAREGGRRDHHGIDIFAPRGTPVVAVREGRISSTRVGGLGGKTVWLRDNRGNNFYYAHLDAQLVERGQRVVPGDTLGLVGNTGNARTTPPHLHFGIYANGPHNPWPFVYSPTTRPSPIRVDERHFGTWREALASRITLLEQPSSRSGVLARFDEPVELHVIGGTSSYYHVRLPDRREGYVAAGDVNLSVAQNRIPSGRARPGATIGS